MVVVLIAARYNRLLEWINKRSYQNIKSIDLIKRIGPKVFLYVDTNLDLDSIINIFKNSINEQGGIAYVYALYGIFNGKIDYHSYVSDKTKMKMPYYQTKTKDITQKEIEDFLARKL